MCCYEVKFIIIIILKANQYTFISLWTQQETENNQLRFNYDVLLHEMVSQVDLILAIAVQ